MAKNPDPSLKLTSLKGVTRTLDDWATMFHLTLVILPARPEASAWVPIARRIFRVFGDADCRTAYCVAGTPTLARRILGDAADHGARRVMIGMAHRGRLNVLAHVVGVSYEAILTEFEAHRGETPTPATPKGGSDDVKYHLGAEGGFLTADDEVVHVILSPNPSHLEAVNPVIEGRARVLTRAGADVTEAYLSGARSAPAPPASSSNSSAAQAAPASRGCRSSAVTGGSAWLMAGLSTHEASRKSPPTV